MATAIFDGGVSPRKKFGPIIAAEAAAEGAVVVATRNSIWICRDSETRAIGLALASNHTRDQQPVRQLLAGCVLAACPQRSERPVQEVKLCLEDYIFDLCLTYQTTTATPATLRTARDRFIAIGDRLAADFAERKAVEETGHDRLALRDLAALSIPGDACVLAWTPSLGRTLVNSFQALAQNERPYGVFGYAYVLERLAMMRSDREIRAIQALAPAGVDITRCRRVHSATGVDTDHVADLVEFITHLSVADRQSVCRAVYQTANLMTQPRDDRAEKAALSALLAMWQWKPFVGVAHDQGSRRRRDAGG